MYEVTCFRCLRIVHITPDDEHCSVCGEDLKHLLSPAYASKYFYDRATHLATAGNLQASIAEVEHGLDYRESSELHLLGGILAKRLSDFDLMRQHVAAIPLDDVLRQEAEWLLRSHQTRQRNLRQGDKARKTGRGTYTTTMDEEPLPFAVDEVTPAPTRAKRQRHGGGLGLGLLTIVLLVGAGWLFFGRNSAGFDFLFPAKELPVQTAVTPDGQNAAASGGPTTENVTGTQPSLILTPTLSSVTPDIPNNVAQQATTPEPLAATTPRSAVDDIDPKYFDLKSFLLQKERQDLAQLEVSASLQGKKLKLKGIVPMDAERRALVDLTHSAPDVTEVDAVDLLVRLPETYTVQPGDTLWDITYKLYGNVGRMQELIQANADRLASPEALRVGMELKVPPNR